MKGSLYLIPNTLSDTEAVHTLPEYIRNIINQVDHYIDEDERSARRLLKKLGIKKPIEELEFFILNKHTDKKNISSFLEPALRGLNIGLLSEAGCPCIADPGSEVVLLAHRNKIKVIPLVGPSSLILALMASGFNGQNFCFHGYLPKERDKRIKKIRELEKESVQQDRTQLFIEAPYRNKHVLEDLLASCSPSTRICIAADLSLPGEWILTRTVEEWKKNIPDINKRQVVFLMYKRD